MSAAEPGPRPAAANGTGGAGGGVARLATRVLAALVLGLLFWSIFFADRGGAGRSRSAASAEPDGRLAAFLLLEGLGFRPEAWRGSPGELPRGHHFVILPSEPPVPLELDGEGTPPLSAREAGAPPDEERGQAGEVGPGSPHGSLRDPRHYARFLREGGTLLLGFEDVDPGFLADTLDLDAFRTFTLRLDEDRDAAAGELLGVSWRPGSALVGLPEPPLESPFEVLGVDGDGGALALELAVGRGRLVLLPSLAFLDNGRIGDDDGGLLLVRLVEAYVRGDARILFDEYALGGWRPDSPLEVAFSGSLGVLSWHVLLLAALLLWRSAWVREFPRDPLHLRGLSPLTRARALTGLLLASRRTAVLARMLRTGVLRRLAARVGLRGEESAFPSDVEPDPDEVGRVLERVAVRTGRDGEREAWRRALLSRDVGSGDELEELAAELAGLERAAARG